MFTLSEINSMGKAEFVRKVGWIFENTPWISEKAWEFKPFPSINALHKIMRKVVEQTPKPQQLALIRAHPHLGTRQKMNPISQQEQKRVGLDLLSLPEYNQFEMLNKQYLTKFSFPFILAVRGFNKNSILNNLSNRLKNSYEQESKLALAEIYKITYYRLLELIINERGETTVENQEDQRLMFYGKGEVFAYRTHAPKLTGVKSIPESTFTQRENTILGVNINVAIGGQKFLPSFTEADNQYVVATDSMKNFIQRHLSIYGGSTIDGFINYVGQKFLQTYPQMETVNITAEEIPFLPTNCINSLQLQHSNLVFKKSRNEKAYSTVKVIREKDEIKLIDHISGVKDIQLIKISGNSFVGFVQDEYTTLPEDQNRPLFIYLNISWKYQNPSDAFEKNQGKYVLAEQVTDISSAVFHNLETKSIQQLIYQIGLRILERFPQLSEVKFESQNRTWDTVVEEIPGSIGKIYSEPRPPYGFQRFTVFQTDLEREKNLTTKWDGNL